MNDYFTAGPPQADLSALGIVTKKQVYAPYFIKATRVVHHLSHWYPIHDLFFRYNAFCVSLLPPEVK